MERICKHPDPESRTYSIVLNSLLRASDETDFQSPRRGNIFFTVHHSRRKSLECGNNIVTRACVQNPEDRRTRGHSVNQIRIEDYDSSSIGTKSGLMISNPFSLMRKNDAKSIFAIRQLKDPEMN
jgi:hypothetical protein